MSSLPVWDPISEGSSQRARESSERAGARRLLHRCPRRPVAMRPPHIERRRESPHGLAALHEIRWLIQQSAGPFAAVNYVSSACFEYERD